MTSVPDPKRHPHAYTLSLLRMATAKLPPGFDDGERERYRRAVERFEAHPETQYEDIRALIVEIGRASWPFRKAYEEMYRTYGRASEEAFLLENLDEGIRGKYERFIHEGGKINHIERATSAEDLMNPSPFERYFTPEEKFAIEQALLVARDQARHEIDQLLMGEKREEYEALVDEQKTRGERLERMIDDLGSFLGLSERWDPVLRDRLRTIEEGWSIVEPGMDEERLEKELEYWRGTLASFLHA